jgi:hypothetical protein
MNLKERFDNFNLIKINENRSKCKKHEHAEMLMKNIWEHLTNNSTCLNYELDENFSVQIVGNNKLGQRYLDVRDIVINFIDEKHMFFRQIFIRARLTFGDVRIHYSNSITNDEFVSDNVHPLIHTIARYVENIYEERSDLIS